MRLTEQFAQARGLQLHTVKVAERIRPDGTRDRPTYPSRTDQAMLGVRAHQTAHHEPQSAGGGYDVLGTGHNLDDEAAVLFGNTLNWAAGYLVRQGPVLEANIPGVVRKVKPLCRIYEREMAAYALLGSIEYIYDECPFAVGATSIYYKELLNRLEADHPGAKLNFYLTFLQAKKAGLFSASADQGRQNLHPCPTCGQPTSVEGECAFCQDDGRVKR